MILLDLSSITLISNLFFLLIYFLQCLFLVLDPRIKLAYYKDHGWEERYITGAKNLVMKTYKEHYAPIEEISTYDAIKTFNDVQSHIFSIGKKRRVQKENEFDEYLKIPVASIDTDVLLWWKVSLFFVIIDLISIN